MLKLLPSFTDFAFLMPIVFPVRPHGGLRDLLSDCERAGTFGPVSGSWRTTGFRLGISFLFEDRGSVVCLGVASDVVYAWLERPWRSSAVVLFAHPVTGAHFPLLFSYYGGIESFRGDCRHHVGRGGIFDHIGWRDRQPVYSVVLVLFYAALEEVREGRTAWRAYRIS